MRHGRLHGRGPVPGCEHLSGSHVGTTPGCGSDLRELSRRRGRGEGLRDVPRGASVDACRAQGDGGEGRAGLRRLPRPSRRRRDRRARGGWELRAQRRRGRGERRARARGAVGDRSARAALGVCTLPRAERCEGSDPGVRVGGGRRCEEDGVGVLRRACERSGLGLGLGHGHGHGSLRQAAWNGSICGLGCGSGGGSVDALGCGAGEGRELAVAGARGGAGSGGARVARRVAVAGEAQGEGGRLGRSVGEGPAPADRHDDVPRLQRVRRRVPLRRLEVERFVAMVARPAGVLRRRHLRGRLPQRLAAARPRARPSRSAPRSTSTSRAATCRASSSRATSPACRSSRTRSRRARAPSIASPTTLPHAERKGDFDVLIIGAGPAGLAAALRAQEKNLRALVLEQATVASSVRSFPRDKLVFDQPLHVPVEGELWLRECTKEELLAQWTRIVRARELPIREHHRVVGRDAERGRGLRRARRGTQGDEVVTLPGDARRPGDRAAGHAAHARRRHRARRGELRGRTTIVDARALRGQARRRRRPRRRRHGGGRRPSHAARDRGHASATAARGSSEARRGTSPRSKSLVARGKVKLAPRGGRSPRPEGSASCWKRPELQ